MKCASLLLVFFLSSITLCAQYQTLEVGHKAPPLKIVRWLKGEPVNEFKKGHVYLLEFGFVSCTPCRKSIPLLSKTAIRFKEKVTLVSIHIWENNKTNVKDTKYVKRVNDFLDLMGDKINYTVAVDVPEQLTADSYMLTATGQKRGVPASFVIDQIGNIVWIGGPNSELDSVLSEVVEGRFMAKEYAARKIERQKEYLRVRNSIYQAKSEGNYQKAFKGIDSLIKAHPEDPGLYFEKFVILKDADDTNANLLVEWMLQSENEDFDSFMFYLVNELIDRKNPNYDLALRTADYVFERAERIVSSTFILKSKAFAYYKMGEYAQAIKTQQAAIDYMKQFGAEYENEVKDLEVLLETYVKKNNVINSK